VPDGLKSGELVEWRRYETLCGVVCSVAENYTRDSVCNKYIELVCYYARPLAHQFRRSIDIAEMIRVAKGRESSRVGLSVMVRRILR
jgi:hypothetical protein